MNEHFRERERNLLIHILSKFWQKLLLIQCNIILNMF